MSGHVEALVEARRASSLSKLANVRDAVRHLADEGRAINVSAVAARAGVSRRFIYDHAELRAEIELRSLETVESRARHLEKSARLTTASLKADLENAKARYLRLEDEVRVLRQRLGESYGHEIVGSVVTNDDHERQVDALESRVLDLERKLERAEDELEATRKINRDLMAQLNARPSPEPA